MKNPNWTRDELILTLDFYFDDNHGSFDKKNPKIIELSNLLKSLPIHKVYNEKFRNPNGVALKLSNFASYDPDYNGKGMYARSLLDESIFDEFSKDKVRLKNLANQIKELTKLNENSNEIQNIEDDEVEDFITEGTIIFRYHKTRERSSKIIKQKKKLVFKQLGKLECEICSFDFVEKYGQIGSGFIECHHKIPLSKYVKNDVTKLDDLALVCSNCHRMLHKEISELSFENFKNKYR
jgi:5-methylcytosine-specific restriction protein A